MHQSTIPSLSQTIWRRWASREFLTVPIVEPLLPVTFGYSLSSETVVMRQLRRWKRLWWRSLTCSHKRTSMWPCRSCWNGTTSALQPEEITSKGTRVSCVYSQYKCPYEKSPETYLMTLIYIKYIWFGLVLWHINHYSLFNAKSSLYMYIKDIWFGWVGFYGISTNVDYLMPNLLYMYILNI